MDFELAIPLENFCNSPPLLNTAQNKIGDSKGTSEEKKQLSKEDLSRMKVAFLGKLLNLRERVL